MTKELFCHDKHMFFCAKFLLVAAPANDSFVAFACWWWVVAFLGDGGGGGK